MAAGFFDDAVLFSPDVPQEVNRLLQTAVIESRHNKPEAEKLFLQAKELDPTCLQTYFALYKFYFYQARLVEAEHCVLEALQESARQGGFPADKYTLFENRVQYDMYATEAGMFYLYTLKAFSFIKLRQESNDEANATLDIIRALDPEDRSGASVIMDLASALEDVA